MLAELVLALAVTLTVGGTAAAVVAWEVEE